MSFTKTFPWFSVFRINLNFVTSMHKRFSIICPLLTFAHLSLDALPSCSFYYQTLCSPPWSRLPWTWSSLSAGFILGSTSSRMFFLAPHFFCVGAPFHCMWLPFSYYVSLMFCLCPSLPYLQAQLEERLWFYQSLCLHPLVVPCLTHR